MKIGRIEKTDEYCKWESRREKIRSNEWEGRGGWRFTINIYWEFR